MIGVYIHIPYCRTICPYCDFVKRPTKGAVPIEFIRALGDEISEYDGPRGADSVFFGGGTPSLIEPSDLEKVLAAVRNRFALSDTAELTLEANPDDITEDLVRAWIDLGVNRVSLAQSFNEEALRYLGDGTIRTARGAPANRWVAFRGGTSIHLRRSAVFRVARDAGRNRAWVRHVSAYGLTWRGSVRQTRERSH